MEDKVNPPEEILDLVDEDDNVIGEVQKSDANRDPKLIHREAGVLLFDGRRNLLLQKRSFRKQVSPGAWEVTAAGHVTKGLTPIEAAHKELKEELGFDTELKFVEKYKVVLPNETHFTYFYLGEYNGQRLAIEMDEVEEARLFSQGEFDKLKSSGAQIGQASASVIRRFWVGDFDHLLD